MGNTVISETREVPLRFYVGPHKFSKKFRLTSFKFPFWTDDISLDRSINSYPVNSFISSALIGEKTAIKHDAGLVYIASRYPRYLTDLSLSYDSFLSKLSQKLRYSSRRASRNFFGQTDRIPSFRSYKTREEITEFYQWARQVAANTYQERHLDISLPDDPAYLAHLQEKASANQARGFLCLLQDKPIAFALALAEEDTLIGQYMGFDSKYSKLSPGIVVKWEAIKELYSEGHFKWFDFTEGEGLHKRRFATHKFECGDVFIVPSTLKNKLLFLIHKEFNNLMYKLDDLLQRSHLKAKVRKWFRR